MKLHPDHRAHAAIAQIVFGAAHEAAATQAAAAQAAMTRRAPPPSTSRVLPPAIYLNGSSFEELDSSWECATCGWHDCLRLQPDSGTHTHGSSSGAGEGAGGEGAGGEGSSARRDGGTDSGGGDGSAGFRVRAPWGRLWQGDHGFGIGQLRKFGWESSLYGATIAFQVPPHSRVLLALLCSYENVGSARVFVAPAGRGRFDAPHFARNAVTISLRWADDSSQQCVTYAGSSGRGAHAVWVQGASRPTTPTSGCWPCNSTGRGIVKVYGVYTQRMSQQQRMSRASRSGEDNRSTSEGTSSSESSTGLGLRIREPTVPAPIAGQLHAFREFQRM